MSVEPVAEILPIGMDATGVYRIAGTRVTLLTFISFYEQGFSAEQISDDFPTLGLENVYLAIGQYLRHKQEFDSYLDRARKQADELERAVRANPATQQLVQKLKSQRKAGNGEAAR